MVESFGMIHTRSYPSMVEVVRYLECAETGEVADVSTVAVFTHYEHKDLSLIHISEPTRPY